MIVPTQTCVASASSVVRAGGRPVFADIRRDTLCLDLQDVRRKITADTAGVMAVHMFGLVAPDLGELQALCRERGLFLLEDAAHAHGASLRGAMAGSLGDAACFSFYATKPLTTGEGGMVTTGSRDLYEKLLQHRNYGRSLHGPLFELASNNFRLAEIPAILGKHQLAELPAMVAHRNRIAAIYRQRLQDEPRLELLGEFPEAHSGCLRFPAYLCPSVDRKAFQQRMQERHAIRVTWMYDPLCHLQPLFRPSHRHRPGDFPVAEKAIAQLINLPTHMGVEETDAVRVAAAVREELEHGNT